MESSREEIRYRLPWPAILAIIIAFAAGCAGRGESTNMAMRSPEVTDTPVTTAILTRTATPTATNEPTPTITSTVTEPAPTTTTGPLSGEQLVSALRSGGYVIYFRHAATDPLPDDATPVDLSDCNTQRNLSTDGETQASAIGEAIEQLEVPIGLVLSSPFCRALDTARLAFGKATSEPALENLETAESEAEREMRIEALRSLLSTPPDGDRVTNNVLVGHGFNISAAADVTIAEGEAAIFRPEGEGRFTLVATVPSNEWEVLVANRPAP